MPANNTIMADLDDFFAKKDKKKSKSKKFACSGEELAKKLEDTTAKKVDKPRKEQTVAADGAVSDVDELNNGEQLVQPKVNIVF